MRKAVLAIALSLHAFPSSASFSQSAAYPRFYVGDIMTGSVKPGQLVETSGHFWVFQSRAFLNADPISARYPLNIDVAGLPRAVRENYESECAADYNGRTSGCSAVVRGKVVQLDGHKAVAAKEIEITK